MKFVISLLSITLTPIPFKHGFSKVKQVHLKVENKTILGVKTKKKFIHLSVSFHVAHSEFRIWNTNLEY